MDNLNNQGTPLHGLDALGTGGEVTRASWLCPVATGRDRENSVATT